MIRSRRTHGLADAAISAQLAASARAGEARVDGDDHVSGTTDLRAQPLDDRRQLVVANVLFAVVPLRGLVGRIGVVRRAVWHQHLVVAIDFIEIPGVVGYLMSMAGVVKEDDVPGVRLALE